MLTFKMSTQRESITHRSALVVAHPDDEALWFSSVLEHVNLVLFCFPKCPLNPVWSNGRERVLNEYPMRNIRSLGLAQAGVFEGAGHWQDPRPSGYGMQLRPDCESLDAYQNNYDRLAERLKEELADIDNIITHNPWGEYGHVEHIQVYQALKSLQSIFGYNLWFSNYCSNRSVSFMSHFVNGYSTKYIQLPVNLGLAHRLRGLYLRHDCWTWYDDYEWFSEESFMQDPGYLTRQKPTGRIFPVNYVKI